MQRLDPIDVLPDDMGSFWPVDDRGEAPSAPLALPSIVASELAGQPVPVREWHVQDMVPARTVTLLYGDGATGKSLLSLQLATATVAGAPWLGRDVRRGNALFFSAEDDADELHRRLVDIAAASDRFDLASLTGLKIIPMAGSEAVLAGPGKGGLIEPTPAWQALRGLATSWEPTLIVIDTLADVFAGDENSRPQARQFIGMLRGLAIDLGASIVVLAHPSVAGMTTGSGTSGSTAWSNSVRSRLYFSRVVGEDEGRRVELDPDLRLLSVMKSNYARGAAELRVRWQQGVFVPADNGFGAAADGLAMQARAELVFMELLDDYTTDGRPVSASPSNSYAPAIFAKDPRAAGVTKTALTTAMNALFQKRMIVVGKFGPPSKERTRIERRETSE